MIFVFLIKCLAFISEKITCQKANFLNKNFSTCLFHLCRLLYHTQSNKKKMYSKKMYCTMNTPEMYI